MFEHLESEKQRFRDEMDKIEECFKPLSQIGLDDDFYQNSIQIDKKTVLILQYSCSEDMKDLSVDDLLDVSKSVKLKYTLTIQLCHAKTKDLIQRKDLSFQSFDEMLNFAKKQGFICVKEDDKSTINNNKKRRNNVNKNKLNFTWGCVFHIVLIASIVIGIIIISIQE